MSEAGVDSAARQAAPRVLLLVPARTYRAADLCGPSARGLAARLSIVEKYLALP